MTRESIRQTCLEEDGVNITDEALDRNIEVLIEMCSKIGDDLNRLSIEQDGRTIYVNTSNVEYIDVRIDMPDASSVDGVARNVFEQAKRAGSKIDAIKTLRHMTGWGLKEASEWVDRNCQ